MLACAGSDPIYAPAPTPEYPPEVVMENGIMQVGNMTYIPMNIEDATPDSYILGAFHVINDWEVKNPDRQIVDIDFHWEQNSRTTTAFFYGVSIYSIPKVQE